MNELIAIAVCFGGAVIGALVTAYFINKNRVPRSEFDVISEQKQAAYTKISELEYERSQIKQNLEATAAVSQKHRERIVALETEQVAFQDKIDRHKTDLEQIIGERAEFKEELAATTVIAQNYKEKVVALEAEREAFQEKIQQHKADLAEMEKKFSEHFKNLAQQIIDNNTAKFKQASEEGLNVLLAPLKTQLDAFKTTIDASFVEQGKEQRSLKTEIQNIILANQSMTSQTESLTKALKGDMKAQGNWGEVLLEKILEESGLRKDKDYIPQGADLKLKHVEDGKALKPDIVVMLPDGKHVVVDSKVSFTHYHRYCETDDAELRTQYLKEYLQSIRAHVSGLAQRRYQDTDKLGTPDFVLMFMPIEGAYSLAIQKDVDVHSFAWDKKIVIVCPSTLFATLRTIASVWRLELQNKNTVEIARQGGLLYDKISAFVDDMTTLGNQLATTRKTYDKAMNKLSDGTGNILRRTETLKELGAKTSKSLPADLLGLDMIEGNSSADELFSAETQEKDGKAA